MFRWHSLGTLSITLIILIIQFLQKTDAAVENTTPYYRRDLKEFALSFIDSIYPGCPQGISAVNSEETNTNDHTWWESNWGRTDASWPKRGTEECWANRGDVCVLPDDQHVVCVPGSRRGSTVNKGWALDPKGQSCQPGVYCLYACEPGYYWTYFNQSETSNFDTVNSPKKGHCDGTWNYGTSTHGIFCKPDGTLSLEPGKQMCALGETYVFAENRLNTHVFICQTVFPGHEIFTIPMLVKPGETVMMTTQPREFWHGPTYSKPTHGDFYVGYAGADIMQACTWDEFSPSGAALLPYEIGSGVEDNSFIYSTHYYYQQPNSEVPEDLVGYKLDLECESSEIGVCGKVARNNDVVKVDVIKRPQAGTTKVKFIFNPPDQPACFEGIYKSPATNHLQLSWLATPTSGVTSSSSVASHSTSGASYSSGFSAIVADQKSDTIEKSEIYPVGIIGTDSEMLDPSILPGSKNTVISIDIAENNTVPGMSTYSSFSSDGTNGFGFSPGDFKANSDISIVNKGQPQLGSQTAYAESHASSMASSGSSLTPDLSFQTGSGFLGSLITNGRKMKTITEKAVSNRKVILENLLKEPIIYCNYGKAEFVKTVGPGEKLLLEEGSLIHLAKKSSMGRVSCQEQHLPWIVSTGIIDESNTDVVYSYGLNPSSNNIHHHTDYKLSLSCVAEDDEEEICKIDSGCQISVNSEKLSDITYSIKPVVAGDQSGTQASLVYSWGTGIAKFLSFFQSGPSSDTSPPVSIKESY